MNCQYEDCQNEATCKIYVSPVQDAFSCSIHAEGEAVQYYLNEVDNAPNNQET